VIWLLYAVLLVMVNIGGLALILGRRERHYGEMRLSDSGLLYMFGTFLTGLMLFFALAISLKTRTNLAFAAMPAASLGLLGAFWLWQELGIRSMLRERRKESESSIKRTLAFLARNPDAIPAFEYLADLYKKTGNSKLEEKARSDARAASERQMPRPGASRPA